MKRFDVIVVGAGPAGIAASTAAAESGRSVLLLDENARPGGQIWRASLRGPDHGREDGETAKSRALHRLRASGATCLYGHSVYDAPDRGVLSVLRDAVGDSAPASGEATSDVVNFRYDKLIVATGARERFLPFPGWTLPGVFGPGGLQALVKGGLDVQGKRVVVAGSGPLLLAVAAHLKGYGGEVVSVAEQATVQQILPFALSLLSHCGKIFQGVQYRMALGNTPFRTGCWPIAAFGNEVRGKLEFVELTDGKRTWKEACDLLACGFHLVPNIELASLLGCALKDGLVLVNEQQQTTIADVYCAGEPTGIGGLEAALLQGEIAGLSAAGKSTEHLTGKRTSQGKFAAGMARAFELRPELRSLALPETIVCRCEDVSFQALQGRRDWTDAKLQTRCGMGPCQGRICGSATEFLFGWKQKSVRPPLIPVPVSALCFQDFQTNSFKENE